MKKRNYLHQFTVFLLLVFIVGCSNLGSSNPTQVISTPTATSEPLKKLSLCLENEPETLFIYGKKSRAADVIFDLIYDGPFDYVNSLSQPVILESLPKLANNSVRYEPMGVNPGDQIVDVFGNSVDFSQGVQFYPRGCQSFECSQIWDGISQVQMDQAIITFELVDGLKWSDGESVKASDSVFSFNIIPHLNILEKEKVLSSIFEYTAQDEEIIQVKTKPGLVTPNFREYFFHPLPEHILGSMNADELLSAEISSKTPLAWGPFEISSWESGNKIVLTKNTNYFRASENLPTIDVIEIKFIGKNQSPQTLIESGDCDIVDSPEIDLLSENELLNISLEEKPGSDWEVLVFGIKPASYDDGYYPYGSDRPDIIGDVQTRMAIAQCIDRNRLIELDPNAFENIPHSYLSGIDSSDQALAFDPTTANLTLQQIGWLDYDQNPATPRLAYGVSNVPDGTVLILNLYTSNSETRTQSANQIANDLSQCGIQINVNTMDITQLFAPGPEGILFGRKFDLALFSWKLSDEPPCYLFESEEIPSDSNYWIGKDDGGGNISGYSNADFDSLCRQARFSSTDEESSRDLHLQAAQILTQDFAVLPLYFHSEFFIKNPTVCIPCDEASDNYPFSCVESWNFLETCN